MTESGTHRSVRRAAVFGLCCLLLLQAGIVVTSAGTADSPAQAEQPQPRSAPAAVPPATGAPSATGAGTTGDPRANVTVTRLPSRPGVVKLTVAYTNLDPNAGLQLALPCTASCTNSRANRSLNRGAMVVSTDGFQPASATRWDLALDASAYDGSASVTYTVGGNLSESARYRATDARNWTWLYLPAVVPETDDPLQHVGISDGEIASEQYLVAGDVPIERRVIHGQRVRFVGYPPNYTAGYAGRYAAGMANVTRDLRMGDRDARLTVWLIQGSRGGDNQFVTPPRGGFHSLSTHEYVHTRQAFTQASSRRMCDAIRAGEDCATWLIEGGASYYADVDAFQDNPHGWFPPPRRHQLDTDTEHDPPLDHLSHPSHSRRAVRTLYALDQRIRNQTGGERSLQDLFRRLNEHAETQGPVTHSVLEQELAALTGTSHSAWLTQYVQGRNETVPSSQLPPRSAVTNWSWLRDGDGHWNTSLSLSANPGLLRPTGSPTRQVTFTLRNDGADPTVGLATRLRTPGAWRCDSVSPAQGWYNATDRTWHVPELAAGESTTVDVTLAPPRAGVDVPNVTAVASDSDGNRATATASGFNASRVRIPGVQPWARVQSVQVADPTPRAGDRIPVSLSLANTGRSGTFEVRLRDGTDVLDRRTVSLSGGNARQLTFEPSFPRPGDRRLQVVVRNRTGVVTDAAQTGRIDVRNASVGVGFDPATNTVTTNATTTVNLTLSDVPNGVDDVAIDLQVNDSRVANVSGLVVHGDSVTTTIGATGAPASIAASNVTGDNGTVRVARVTLSGRHVGWANLSATVRQLDDREDNHYAVATGSDADVHVVPQGTGASGLLAPEKVIGWTCPPAVCDERALVDERFLLAVEDGEAVRYYRGRLEERTVTAFERIEDPDGVDPTVSVWTDADAIERLSGAAEPAEPLTELLAADRITIERHDEPEG